MGTMEKTRKPDNGAFIHMRVPVRNAMSSLRKLESLDAPESVIGHAALCLAMHCLCEYPSFKNVARWIVKQEQDITKMLNPETDEYKEMMQITKDLEDDDFERAARFMEE